MSMSVPVRVQGHDPDGTPWTEMASSSDASLGGVALKLRHAVALGQVLHLSLPLPKAFRRYDLVEASYRVFALVRDVMVGAPASRVGLHFLGKNPPKGYETRPGGRFLLPGDVASSTVPPSTGTASDSSPPPGPGRSAPSAERRSQERVGGFFNLRIEWRDRAGVLRGETTIAEDISRSGARVLTTLPIGRGESVEVVELGPGGFRCSAQVQGVFVGPDKVPRLNLVFVGGEAPERLLLG
jgi:hypothetical protein